jgi:hypothetical protein
VSSQFRTDRFRTDRFRTHRSNCLIRQPNPSARDAMPVGDIGFHAYSSRFSAISPVLVIASIPNTNSVSSSQWSEFLARARADADRANSAVEPDPGDLIAC